MLREELVKKSELIKTLASKVTTPKRNQKDSTSSKEGDEVEKLQSEIENLNGKHSAELNKVKSAYDKIIKEFKDTNTELLSHVPASDAKRVMSVKRTVEDSEDDHDENVEPKSVLKKLVMESADSSMVEATPASKNSNNKPGRRTRGRRKKMSATTQVSFEDSTVSNMTTDFEASSMMASDEDSCKSKKPKRGSRISKNSSRPSRKAATNVKFEILKTEDTTEDNDDSSKNSSSGTNLLEPLCDSSNKVLTPLKEDVQVPMKTPATNRKRKLFPLTPGPDVSTKILSELPFHGSSSQF